MRRGYLSLGIKDIFDPKGRIDRLTYFIYGAILGIISVVIQGPLLAFSAVLGDTAQSYISEYPAIYLALVVLPLLYGQFCIYAKRLHDLNLPAILAVPLFGEIIFNVVFSFVPPLEEFNLEPKMLATIGMILGGAIIVAHLLLLFVPGTRGPNRYGSNNLGNPLPKPKILEG